MLFRTVRTIQVPSKWQGTSAFQLMTSCSLDAAQRGTVRRALRDEDGGSARGVCRYQTYSGGGGVLAWLLGIS